MTEDESFLRAMLASPDDRVARLLMPEVPSWWLQGA